eukprot:scaffold15108_cov180-Amphora_coffeaeformis.AAC.34
MSKRIASLGLLMLPFVVGMAPEAAEEGRVRPITRGEAEELGTSEGTVQHPRRLMMMKKKSSKKKTVDFIPPRYHTPPPTEDYYYYYSKGKGKGKGRSGGMMMKSGKSSSGNYYYADNYHKPTHPPTGVQPPAATFIQTMGCYAQVSEDGTPCIYSHNPDVEMTYRVDQMCSWMVTADAILMVDYFEIEANFDFLTVGDVQFTSTGEGLDGSPVFAGDMVTFESDMLNPMDPLPGFKVCLADPV